MHSFIFLSLFFIDNPPRLVGYNCQGASGPLYAHEESDFPLCERVETIELKESQNALS